MKALKLWRGATFDGLGILFLGWLYGVSIVKFDWVAWSLIALGGVLLLFPLATNYQKVFNTVKSRRTQIGAKALVIIILNL